MLSRLVHLLQDKNRRLAFIYASDVRYHESVDLFAENVLFLQGYAYFYPLAVARYSVKPLSVGMDHFIVDSQAIEVYRRLVCHVDRISAVDTEQTLNTSEINVALP